MNNQTKMNKAQLKRLLQDRGSHYFDRETMRLFGDTMSNYYVPAKPVEVYIAGDSVNNHKKVSAWPLYRVRPVKHGLQTTAFFNVDTLEQVWPIMVVLGGAE